jgi:hypothetical protein
MSTPYTYPDPRLSLWQASVAEVHSRKPAKSQKLGMTTSSMAAPKIAAEDDLMSSAHLLAGSITGEVLRIHFLPLRPVHRAPCKLRLRFKSTARSRWLRWQRRRRGDTEPAVIDRECGVPSCAARLET